MARECSLHPFAPNCRRGNTDRSITLSRLPRNWLSSSTLSLLKSRLNRLHTRLKSISVTVKEESILSTSSPWSNGSFVLVSVFSFQRCSSTRFHLLQSSPSDMNGQFSVFLSIFHPAREEVSIETVARRQLDEDSTDQSTETYEVLRSITVTLVEV